MLLSPADLLIVVSLTVISAAFHECGHAAACRYGGAKPGRIGVGIYLVWPSFFTNVTDSYRLSRCGRLRTDLGGLYFNLIFILILAGLYTATSSQILLLVIAVTHLEMLEQLLPFVRFDGYFILSDLAGVPDLFARVVPILRSVLPGSRRDPRVGGLRPGARKLVIGWVACVIPLLTLTVGYLLIRLPAINRALWHSASREAHLTATAIGGQHYAAGAVDALGVGLAVLSAAGSLYVVSGLVRRAATVGLRCSAGHICRRVLVALGAAMWVTLLAAFWMLDGQFRGW
jgi:putative peptide zinc metalloprotease protein